MQRLYKALLPQQFLFAVKKKKKNFPKDYFDDIFKVNFVNFFFFDHAMRLVRF